MNAKVLKEVKRAYNEETFNLEFRASEPVNKYDAVKIMAKALGCKPDEDGYNDFRPELLNRLPEDARVWLAREYSVCVYFYTETELPESFQDTMRADEFGLTDSGDGVLVPEYRLWWD